MGFFCRKCIADGENTPYLPMSFIGEAAKEDTLMTKWECTVCGYIYDPEEEGGVPFEELPDDWVCPLCGVGKDEFQPLE